MRIRFARRHTETKNIRRHLRCGSFRSAGHAGSDRFAEWQGVRHRRGTRHASRGSRFCRIRTRLPATHRSVALDTSLCGDGLTLGMVCVCRCSLVSVSPLKAMRVRFNVAALRQTKPKEYAVRFAFGGTISLLAGVVAHYYGPTMGGLFLAFPAIFPAGVTLIARHEERRKRRAGLSGKERGRLAAASDTRGALIGACGLFCFAFMVHFFLPVLPTVAALFLATLAWLASSLLLWRVR